MNGEMHLELLLLFLQIFERFYSSAVVMESSGFMNALIQQQTALPVKKKKKVATPPSPKVCVKFYSFS